MKKFLIVVGLSLLVLLGILFTLPFLFKDQIFDRIKVEINKNVNADVDIQDYSMTLFKDFPNFTFGLENVSVMGRDSFAGVPLLSLKNFDFSIDLKSLFGQFIAIHSFGLNEAEIYIKVLPSGLANYDIAITPEGESAEEENKEQSTEKSSPFRIMIDHYAIKNTSLTYDDQSDGTFFMIKDLNHKGKGDFSENIVDLKTTTSIAQMDYKLLGIPYLSKAQFESTLNLNINQEENTYIFNENSFKINELLLGLDGKVQLLEEDKMNLDLHLNSNQTDFKAVLSLIPKIYSADFKDLKAEGVFNLDLKINGLMDGENYPGLDLNFSVENGKFQYPDLSKSMNDIQIKLLATKKQGDLDLLGIDLSKFHFSLGGNPFDVSLQGSHLISDPNIAAKAVGNINLADFNELLATTQKEKYEGLLSFNVNIKGLYSSLEKEEYEQFKATGNILVNNLLYNDGEMENPLKISTMQLAFNPSYLDLSAFSGSMGQSDFSLKGRIDHYIPYALKDETLSGTIHFNAEKLVASDFMSFEEAPAPTEPAASTQTASTEVAPTEPTQIPSNLNIQLNAFVKQMDYDGLILDNSSASMALNNSVASISNFYTYLLKGSMQFSGYFDTKNPLQPKYEMDIKITNFDLPTCYKAFDMVKTMAPIAENAKGSFNTSLNINGQLNGNLDPLYNTINADGSLKTNNIMVENSPSLKKLADKMQLKNMDKLELNNLLLTYTITDGKVQFQPFEMSFGKANATVSGWSSFDSSLYYTMDVRMPSSELNSIAGGITAMFKDFIPEILSAKVIIEGMAYDPQIKVSLADMMAGSSPKDRIKEKVDAVKKEAVEKINQQVDKAKEEAAKRISQETERIRTEANNLAKKTRDNAKIAADKIKTNGYKNADNLEASTKNPLEKVAAKETAKKMRAEADKAAQKTIQEGENTAKNILKEAEDKIKNLQ